MDFVILAAGEGKRLKPITLNKPKCMVRINDKSIIHHNIEVINEVDSTARIIIIMGYKSDILYRHCRGCRGYKIYKEQPIRNGTASAIYLTKDIVDDNFVVISGDTWIEENYIRRLIRHPNSLLYVERNDKLEQYGTLDMEDNLITKINEKESNPTSNRVNAGLYHFTKDIFKSIERTECDNRFNERIITNSINKYIQDGNKFYGYKINRMLEVTVPSDIKEVERILNER